MRILLALILIAVQCSPQEILVLRRKAPPAGGGAPPAFVQDDGNLWDPFNSSRSVTFGISTTSGNMILVPYFGASSISTCTDNKSNTYSILGTTEFQACAAYNITGGSSHQVTVTLNASNGNQGAVLIFEYSGIATSSALDQSCEASDFIANVSCTTGTTTVASELVVGLVRTAASTTAGAGFTLRQVFGNYRSEDKVVSSTGAQVVNFTHAESSANLTGLTFKGQ